MTKNNEGSPNPDEQGQKGTANPTGTDNKDNGSQSDDKDYKSMFEDQQKRNAKLEADIKALKEAGNNKDDGNNDGGEDKSAAEFTNQVKAIADKYDLEAGFVEDIAKLAASQGTRKAEAKLAKELEKRDTETKQARIEREFDTAFDRISSNDKYKGVEVSKENVKALQFANPDKTVEQIMEELYGGVLRAMGRDTTEDTRQGAGGGDNGIDASTVDFENMTAKQREAVMADPEAKAKYYAYLDQEGK